MKNSTLTILLLLVNLYCFAQDTEAPTVPVNFQFPIQAGIAGPQSTVIEWEHATDNVGVTEYEVYVNGEYLETVPFNGSSATQLASYANLTNGTYCYKIMAKDAAGNSSAFTNEICWYVNCAWCVPDPTDLFISGYLNFSGDNKAIEISNLTESDVDLSSYSLKISHNGAAIWSTTTYSFPQNTTVLNGDTYIIAHSNITMCANVINDYNDSIISFDGDDVIGLFKNDVLIDIIGELGSTATVIEADTFLKVVTMINEGLPNTIYNSNRWHDNNSNINNCPNQLGHAALGVLNIDTFEADGFQIYPNPVKGNTLQFNTKNNQTINSISVIDINGRVVLNTSNMINNQLDIQSIKQGIYFVKIKSGNKISTHKLVRQ